MCTLYAILCNRERIYSFFLELKEEKYINKSLAFILYLKSLPKLIILCTTFLYTLNNLTISNTNLAVFRPKFVIPRRYHSTYRFTEI